MYRICSDQEVTFLLNLSSAIKQSFFDWMLLHETTLI